MKMSFVLSQMNAQERVIKMFHMARITMTLGTLPSISLLSK